MLSIRKTTYLDLIDIDRIYQCAKLQMKKDGNKNQWSGAYPNSDDTKKDISNECSFVILNDNRVIGTFAFIIGEEPTYLNIENGSWKNNKTYGTIHRIASDGTCKGVFDYVINYLKKYNIDIRIDTYKDNKRMLHLIEKNNFSYCGIIYVHDGSPRMAFQKEAI